MFRTELSDLKILVTVGLTCQFFFILPVSLSLLYSKYTRSDHWLFFSSKQTKGLVGVCFFVRLGPVGTVPFSGASKLIGRILKYYCTAHVLP